MSEVELRNRQAAEPKNPEWSVQLGVLLLDRTVHAVDSGAKYAAASAALKELERARKQVTVWQDRARLSAALVRASYMVERFDKTKEYAEEWLKRVRAGDPDYGDAQHWCHTALGLMALHDKDVRGAADHLAQSSDHKGSPLLNRSGPCMDLAGALSMRGERDAVSDYLDACGRFWPSGAKELAQWQKELASGAAPDFSGHLSF